MPRRQIVVEEDYAGKKLPRAKYGSVKSLPAKEEADDIDLDPADKKALAKLISKYGPDAIQSAIDTVGPARHVGRPPKWEMLRYFERANLAEFVDDLAAEFARVGHKHAGKSALQETADLTGMKVETIKRYRREGRKYMAEIKAGLAERNAFFKAARERK